MQAYASFAPSLAPSTAPEPAAGTDPHPADDREDGAGRFRRRELGGWIEGVRFLLAR
jgi:hypothetical protein